MGLITPTLTLHFNNFQPLMSCHPPICSYPPVSQGMFERGPLDLVYFVMQQANEHMSRVLQGADMASLSVNERIKVGVRARLEFMEPHLKSWPQAMALGAHPKYLPDTIRELAVMVDEVWYYAGDRATDLHWYTRRSLLFAVYVATETYMLTDTSPAYSDTWAFLDRRLAEVALFGRQAGESLATAQAVAGGVGSIAGAAFDVVRPVVSGPLQSVPRVLSQLSEAVMAGMPSRGNATAAGATTPTAFGSGGEGSPPVGGASPASRGATGSGSNPLTGLAQSAFTAAAPMLSSGASILSGIAMNIAHSAEARGIKLPTPPPMFEALLAGLAHSSSGAAFGASAGAGTPVNAAYPSYNPSSGSSSSGSDFGASGGLRFNDSPPLPFTPVSDTHTGERMVATPTVAPAQPLV